MTASGGGYLRSVSLPASADVDWASYPYTVPAVQALRDSELRFADGVTFLVGENATGKSTLVEALAVATGLNPEGGSRSFRFSTRGSESELGHRLRLRRSVRKPRTDYFLRAESFYTLATEIDALGADTDPRFAAAYGGGSLHEQSHGEAFLALLGHRFGPNGFYLLDEPEAALSVRSTFAVLARIHDLCRQGCQFVIATHSPVLLALPGATILSADDGLRPVSYDEAAPVELTRRFLADPRSILDRLLAPE